MGSYIFRNDIIITIPSHLHNLYLIKSGVVLYKGTRCIIIVDDNKKIIRALNDFLRINGFILWRQSMAGLLWMSSMITAKK